MRKRVFQPFPLTATQLGDTRKKRRRFLVLFLNKIALCIWRWTMFPVRQFILKRF
jgi:hypothetical protein